jgi:RHS repeat-associated protein
LTDGSTLNSDPFGNNPPNQNPSGQGTFNFNLRFPGQYYDIETGTHYNNFRDYDPNIGRYVESDPIGLRGGINTYTYVKGNPISKSDPTGLDSDIVNGILKNLSGNALENGTTAPISSLLASACVAQQQSCPTGEKHRPYVQAYGDCMSLANKVPNLATALANANLLDSVLDSCATSCEAQTKGK